MRPNCYIPICSIAFFVSSGVHCGSAHDHIESPAAMSRLLSALFFLALLCSAAAAPVSLPLLDSQRQRAVPVELYYPPQASACSPARPCPVAILNPGYGMSARDYSFIAEALNDAGYLVASIQHGLPGDAPTDPQGDLPRQRQALAAQGADNIRYARRALASALPGYDWQHPVLVGHSLGGDSAARLAGDAAAGIPALITLDNRRAALPRSASTRVLSLRATDTQADPGVLPSAEDQQRYGACIIQLDNARHNDMQDGGSDELKAAIVQAILHFLQPLPGGGRAYACR
jgi:predicted dienelactone hydrolase